MPRKKGSSAKKRHLKTTAKAPAEDEAPQDLQAQVTVQVHAPPAGAASPDNDPQADAGPVAPGGTPVATPPGTTTATTTSADTPSAASLGTTTATTTSADTPAAAPEAPIEVGEVGPPALQEGETLLVKEVRPSTTPPQAALVEEEEPVLVGKGCGRRHCKSKEKAACKVPKKDWSLDVAMPQIRSD